MARIVLAAQVRTDLDRILTHHLRNDSENGAARLEAIIAALGVLQTSPYIGRPVQRELRELVIGSGRHAFVALYRYDLAHDVVRVLGIRAAREAGYRGT